jgi:hypothetical protein
MCPQSHAHAHFLKKLLSLPKFSQVADHALFVFVPLQLNHLTPSLCSGDDTPNCRGRLLKDEIAVRDPPRALTVLPAFGKPTAKSAPAGTDSRDHVAVKKAGKKTLSWAEIAQKQRDDDDHSFCEILTSTN